MDPADPGEHRRRRGGRFDAYGADGQLAETRTLDSLGAGEQFTLDAAADFTPETSPATPG